MFDWVGNGMSRIWKGFWNGPLPWLGMVSVAALLIFGATGGSIYLLVRQGSAAASPVYLTRSAYIGNLTVTVPATGTIVPARSYNLNFRISGQLAAIDVQVGQQVQAGQVLASLDTTQLQDMVAQAQAQVNSAQAVLAAAQTVANDQESLYNASVNSAAATCDTDDTNLADDTSAVQSCVDKIQAQAQVARDQAQQQLAQAQGALSTAQAALKTAQDNLAAATLTAPASGTVAAINGSVGQYVSPSTPATGGTVAPLIVLTNLDALQVDARVSSADIMNIQVGQPVRLSVPAQPGPIFSGSVASFSPTGQNNSYMVQINVDNQSIHGVRLLPGMTATLRIAVIQRKNTLLVSNDALRYAGSLPPTPAARAAAASRQLDSENIFDQPVTTVPMATAGSSVVVFQAGTLVKRRVTLGVSNGKVTQVIAGLKPGDATVVGEVGSAFIFRPGALKHGLQSRSLDAPRRNVSSG